MTRDAINFSWLVKLCWGAIVGQVLTVFAVMRFFAIALPISSLASILSIELATNIACVLAARGVVREWWSGSVMALDVVLLTLLLHFTGGPFNPFSFLYLVEISVAAVILNARWTWALVVLSLLGSGSLFAFERDPLGGMSHAQHMALHLRGMWVAFGVAATFIVYFLLRVRRDLEARERELAEAEARGARQERLASLATLAAGAAHELATPLGTIALAAKELERQLERLDVAERDARALEDVHLIRAQVDRCRSILDRMSADAGQTAGEATSEVTMGELLRAAVDGLRASPVIEIDPAAADDRVRVPPRAVAQAVRSLLKNAQEASPERAISLSARQGETSMQIEIVDHGAGMSAEILARAGEPFFTTKAPGRGMGLGLFLTRTLLEQLGGQLSLSSEPGRGTRAVVALPRR